MLLCCNSYANGATYALDSIGHRTDPWGTPVVMVFSCETILFTRTTLFDYAGTMLGGHAHRHTIRIHAVVTSMVSNAAVRSSNTTSTLHRLSVDCAMSL